MASVFGVEDEVFAKFAFYSSAVLLKTVLMSLWTARHRIPKNVSIVRFKCSHCYFFNQMELPGSVFTNCYYSLKCYDLEITFLLARRLVYSIPHNPEVLKTLQKELFENIVGKGEKAGNQHFSFSQNFFIVPQPNFIFSITFILSSASTFDLVQSENLSVKS